MVMKLGLPFTFAPASTVREGYSALIPPSFFFISNPPSYTKNLTIIRLWITDRPGCQNSELNDSKNPQPENQRSHDSLPCRPIPNLDATLEDATIRTRHHDPAATNSTM
jgi:hypothetical protein